MTTMYESQKVFQSLSENGNLSRGRTFLFHQIPERHMRRLHPSPGLFLQTGTPQQTLLHVPSASPLAWQRIPTPAFFSRLSKSFSISGKFSQEYRTAACDVLPRQQGLITKPNAALGLVCISVIRGYRKPPSHRPSPALRAVPLLTPSGCQILLTFLHPVASSSPALCTKGRQRVTMIHSPPET